MRGQNRQKYEGIVLDNLWGYLVYRKKKIVTMATLGVVFRSCVRRVAWKTLAAEQVCPM